MPNYRIRLLSAPFPDSSWQFCSLWAWILNAWFLHYISVVPPWIGKSSYKIPKIALLLILSCLCADLFFAWCAEHKSTYIFMRLQALFAHAFNNPLLMYIDTLVSIDRMIQIFVLLMYYSAILRVTVWFPPPQCTDISPLMPSNCLFVHAIQSEQL